MTACIENLKNLGLQSQKTTASSLTSKKLFRRESKRMKIQFNYFTFFDKNFELDGCPQKERVVNLCQRTERYRIGP